MSKRREAVIQEQLSDLSNVVKEFIKSGSSAPSVLFSIEAMNYEQKMLEDELRAASKEGVK